MSFGKLIFNKKVGDTDIHIYEQSGIRYLTFGDDAIQSATDMLHPNILHLPVQRAFFSPLLFTPEPEDILLLGYGAGSIPHYLDHTRPDIHCLSIEKQQQLIQLAKSYFTVKQDTARHSQNNTIIGDAKDVIFTLKKQYGLIIVDITENHWTPDWVFNSDTLHQLKSILTETGALVINIITRNTETFKALAWSARQVFKQSTAFLQLPENENTLLLALKHNINHLNEANDKQREDFNAHIMRLKVEWGFEFDMYYDNLITINPKGSGII
jgi:spermidine synthase